MRRPKMEGLVVCANASARSPALGSLSAVSSGNASPSSSSVAVSKTPSSFPGIVCSSSSPRSNVERHTPPERLRLLVPLAAAGLLSVAAATAADTDTTTSFVEGILSQEPANALSLPTWTIHVASVVEWIVAMGLVWRFGDNPKNAAWKGLAWGMVPLLGGAMCACTWHFFYNAESLEILVVLQAALTMIGNFTMWLAAYRIYQSSSKSI